MKTLESSEAFTKRSDWLFPVLVLASLFALGRAPRAAEETPADWVKRSRELAAAGRYEEALGYSDKLLERFPKNHVYLDQAAHLNHELGRLDAEASLLERYIQVAPDPGEACMDLPRVYWKLERSSAMIDSAERCLALEPKNSDFTFSRAIALERGAKMTEALAAYRKGMSKFPGYTDFAIGHARVLMRIGKLEDSSKEIAEVLKTHSTNGDALEVLEALRVRGVGGAK